MQTPEAHWPGILIVYLVSSRPVTTLSQKLKCLAPEEYHLRLSCSLHMHSDTHMRPDIHVPYTYRHPMHMNAGTHMHVNLHVHDYINMHAHTCSQAHTRADACNIVCCQECGQCLEFQHFGGGGKRIKISRIVTTT